MKKFFIPSITILATGAPASAYYFVIEKKR